MKNIVLILILIAAIGLPLYAQSAWQNTSASGISLQYRTAAGGQNLECNLSAATSGWVAVGFNQTDMMQNANFIIGYVSGGMGYIRDDWGTGTQTHASDTSLGGVNNVTLVVGTETAGTTLLHFTLPLATTDQYDRPLVMGQAYPIILAKGENGTDNFTGSHSGAGYAQISVMSVSVASEDNLAPAQINGITGNFPNPFHSGTSIRYHLAKAAPVQIHIYNNRGQMVYETNIASKTEGDAEFVWDGRDSAGRISANGVYMVKMLSPSGTSKHRITLAK